MFNKKYKVLESLAEVKIPKELAIFWKELKSSNIDERDFNYKYFGKITPMSPDRMNKYSKLAPPDGDRYSFYKRIEELKKTEKISKIEEREIVTNSFWDPYVMTIHLKNELDKYCRMHYIKYCIPIATSHGSSEIIFIGFTESKEQDGIFYYNATFQDYPIFICKTIDEFTVKSKKDNSKSEELMKRLGKDHCFHFHLNSDFELDGVEVDNAIQFICNSFKTTFNKEINIFKDGQIIELSFEYRGLERIHKYNKSSLTSTESLQMIIMSINNSITEFDKNFLNNYKYYLTENTIQLLHDDQATEFIREGLIKPYFKNPIPHTAYTSKGKREGKYDSELLEMIKGKNWSQAEIDRFLDVYGDIGFTNKYKE